MLIRVFDGHSMESSRLGISSGCADTQTDPNLVVHAAHANLYLMLDTSSVIAGDIQI